MLSIINYIFLTLIIMLFSLPGAYAQEEEVRYRVEVLVFRQLDFEDEPDPRSTITSYVAARDFEADGLPAMEQFEPGSCNPPPTPPFRPGVDPAQDDPERAVTPVTSRSDVMTDVWRRLRLGAHYRPEAFLAWDQGASEPFPLMRIHNQEVLDLEDPEPERRPLASRLSWTCAGSDGEIVYSADYVLEYDPLDGNLLPRALPRHLSHYRLDGTVQLRRARFLHIDLDVVYRQPLVEPAAQAVIPFPIAGSVTSAGEPIGPPRYEVQWLKQSRQVRTGRMEYFDSPWLGVLVWVSEIEPVDPASDSLSDQAGAAPAAID